MPSKTSTRNWFNFLYNNLKAHSSWGARLQRLCVQHVPVRVLLRRRHGRDRPQPAGLHLPALGVRVLRRRHHARHGPQHAGLQLRLQQVRLLPRRRQRGQGQELPQLHRFTGQQTRFISIIIIIMYVRTIIQCFNIPNISSKTDIFCFYWVTSINKVC